MIYYALRTFCTCVYTHTEVVRVCDRLLGPSLHHQHDARSLAGTALATEPDRIPTSSPVAQDYLAVARQAAARVRVPFRASRNLRRSRPLVLLSQRSRSGVSVRGRARFSPAGRV
jgi:hypothetical protein